jgi:hypothetical protein
MSCIAKHAAKYPKNADGVSVINLAAVKIAETNPFVVAEELYAEYGGDGGKARKPRVTIKPRLPKEKRVKIRSRNDLRRKR